LDVPALFNNEEPAAVVIGLLDIKGLEKPVATCTSSNVAWG